MHTTKIWLVEPFPFILLKKKSQEAALENVRKKVQEEAPELMNISKEFLESMAKQYMFCRSGKILKKNKGGKK